MSQVNEPDILDGVALLGRKLLEWADYASLDELTATLNTGDGPAHIRVDADRHVWFEHLDITPLVGKS